MYEYFHACNIQFFVWPSTHGAATTYFSFSFVSFFFCLDCYINAISPPKKLKSGSDFLFDRILRIQATPPRCSISSLKTTEFVIILIVIITSSAACQDNTKSLPSAKDISLVILFFVLCVCVCVVCVWCSNTLYILYSWLKVEHTCATATVKHTEW